MQIAEQVNDSVNRAYKSTIFDLEVQVLFGDFLIALG